MPLNILNLVTDYISQHSVNIDRKSLFNIFQLTERYIRTTRCTQANDFMNTTPPMSVE